MRCVDLDLERFGLSLICGRYRLATVARGVCHGDACCASEAGLLIFNCVDDLGSVLGGWAYLGGLEMGVAFMRGDSGKYFSLGVIWR